MKKQPHKQINRLGLCALILLHSATVLSQPKLSSSEREKLILQLKSIVRQDSFATETIRDLHDLQKQQQSPKMEALDACLMGLTSFMQGKFKPAGKELTKAKRNPHVQDIVEFVLGGTDLLDQIVKECQRYRGMSKCNNCGGYGFKCCKLCEGIGRVRCTDVIVSKRISFFCGGTGKVGGLGWLNNLRGKRPSSFDIPPKCSECKGGGWEVCYKCKGIGIEECPSCHPIADRILQAEDYDKIDELSGVMGYLKGGGIDFFLGNFQAPLVFNEPDQKE